MGCGAIEARYLRVVTPGDAPSALRSVDRIADPKKPSGHYIVSKSVLLTLYSVKKCLIDTI